MRDQGNVRELGHLLDELQRDLARQNRSQSLIKSAEGRRKWMKLLVAALTLGAGLFAAFQVWGELVVVVMFGGLYFLYRSGGVFPLAEALGTRTAREQDTRSVELARARALLSVVDARLGPMTRVEMELSEDVPELRGRPPEGLSAPDDSRSWRWLKLTGDRLSLTAWTRIDRWTLPPVELDQNELRTHGISLGSEEEILPAGAEPADFEAALVCLLAGQR